jgi:rSAM/selenodomain-associated transferase 1
MAALTTARARGVICVFAKPPVPGRAKTRLAAEVGEAAAAALARTFLRDTWAAVTALRWARHILATTDAGTAGLAEIDAEERPQGPGDLGARLERILGRALREGARFALAIGADTPGLPARLLEEARDALATAPAVLGPSEDGGFYLLGIRRCPPGLLAGLPWSRRDTFACTLARLHERGLETRVLLPWFDVDHARDLERLRGLLDRGEIAAPETARALALMTKPRTKEAPCV